MVCLPLLLVVDRVEPPWAVVEWDGTLVEVPWHEGLDEGARFAVCVAPEAAPAPEAVDARPASPPRREGPDARRAAPGTSP